MAKEFKIFGHQIDSKIAIGGLAAVGLLLSACAPAVSAATVTPATKPATTSFETKSQQPYTAMNTNYKNALETDIAAESIIFPYHGLFPRISSEPVFVEFNNEGLINRIYTDPANKEAGFDVSKYNGKNARLFIKATQEIQEMDIVLGQIQRDEWEGQPVFLEPNGPEALTPFLTYRYNLKGGIWETSFAVLKPGLPIQVLSNENGLIKLN